jgi:hypothetical protein
MMRDPLPGILARLAEQQVRAEPPWDREGARVRG